MTVSKDSTPNRGHELIERLERFQQVCTNRLNHNDFKFTQGDVQTLQAHLRNAIYRLRFLEMCVLGLTETELTNARDAGQWIEHVKLMQTHRYDE